MRSFFHKLSRSHTILQSILLTVVALVLLIRLYGLNLSNGVMLNYYYGGVAFVNKEDPYAVTLRKGPSNQFKYSPLFAVGMAGMVKLNRNMVADEAWAIGGMVVFFVGLTRWINFSGRLKNIIMVALFAAIGDLIVCLSVKQINALIAGLVLIALAEYRDGRFFSSGAILMLATNLKVYPVVFLIALGLLAQPRYWFGAFTMGIITFLIPACFVGWTHNFNMHLAWVRLVLGDSSGVGVLDLHSSFQRLGFGQIATILRWFLLFVSIPVFFSYLRVTRKIDWRPWFTFGMAALLLLSPRTEVYTYVLLAPSYVLMAAWFDESSDVFARRIGKWVVTILAVAIASCAFIDDKWSYSEGPLQTIRVVGALGFWFIAGWILIRHMIYRISGCVETAAAR